MKTKVFWKPAELRIVTNEAERIVKSDPNKVITSRSSLFNQAQEVLPLERNRSASSDAVNDLMDRLKNRGITILRGHVPHIKSRASADTTAVEVQTVVNESTVPVVPSQGFNLGQIVGYHIASDSAMMKTFVEGILQGFLTTKVTK